MADTTKKLVTTDSEATTFNVKLLTVEQAHAVIEYVNSLGGECFTYRSYDADRAKVLRDKEKMVRAIGNAMIAGKDVTAMTAELRKFCEDHDIDL